MFELLSADSMLGQVLQDLIGPKELELGHPAVPAATWDFAPPQTYYTAAHGLGDRLPNKHRKQNEDFGAWNFGPSVDGDHSSSTVPHSRRKLCSKLGFGSRIRIALATPLW